jgi:3-phenylpropionate/trans-cinnamate dioxygenase ferredoxin component
MEFTKVAKVSDIPIGNMIIVKVDEDEILLSNVAGKYYAISNKCTHMGGSLVKGKLEGKIVTCPRHGAKFDVTNGKNVGPAKIVFLKMNVKDEKIFNVKIEGDDILISNQN